MDKEKEIKTLQSLKGETYFNQFFSNDDIDKMCQNIRNDLAIELGCGFNDKARLLQQRLVESNLRYKDNTENFAEAIIDALDGDIPGEVYGVLSKMTSVMFVIKYKRKKQYEITDKEIDYLIRQTSEYHDTTRRNTKPNGADN